MIKKTIIVLIQLCFFFLCTPSSYSGNATLVVGSGSGDPGSRNVPISVALSNYDDNVIGVQFRICDKKNYLKVTGCQGKGRGLELNCDYGENMGCAKIGLFGMRDLIELGEGPILEFYYTVSAKAPPGEAIILKPIDIIVSPDTRSIQQGRNKFDPVTINAVRGNFFITGDSEDETTTTTTSPDDYSETDTEEPETYSNQGMATSQLASGTNKKKSSRGTTSPLTYGSPRETTPATTSTLSNRSARQASPRKTTASTQESRGSSPSGTTRQGPDEDPTSARIVVSPESATITSGGLIALDPQTINGDIAVEGDYTYAIIPPSPIGSKVDKDGQFIAGTNTSSTEIAETIEVTDTANGNAKAFVVIIVAGRKQPSSECELFISPLSATLSSGKSLQFKAHNSDQGCSEGLYQWKVNSKIGSIINGQGLYTAGKNRDIDPALDIIIVTDTVNSVSTDALITVSIEPDVPNVASAPLNPQPAGVDGKKSYPKMLILLTILTIVGGIIVIRKFKH